MPALPRVLFYAVLQGVDLPRIDALGELRRVKGAVAVPDMPEAERAAIEILVTNAGTGCDVKIMDLLPNLRRVISTGAGLDKHDQAAMAARGITLRPIGEAVTDDVADLTLALTLMTARSLVRADAFARSGDWVTGKWAPGRSLVGATMGIAGVSGRIGKAIASRAEAFKMKIAGLARPSAEGLGYPLYPDMTSLAQASDFLVLALPGGAGMKHLVGKAELEALGAGGTLINIGRGTLVDTEALIEALEKNVIAAAGLDVVEGEPVIPARLAALKNVIITPHIGAATVGARGRGAAIAEAEALAALGVAVPA